MNDNAKKWVASLRSGKRKQTKGRLRDEDGFCCLGDACEVAMENGIALEVQQDDSGYLYDQQACVLPDVVRYWLGLRLDGGEYGSNNNMSLMRLNDGGKTFAEIADIIEREPKGLFVKESGGEPSAG
jgi:hypothetical protein